MNNAYEFVGQDATDGIIFRRVDGASAASDTSVYINQLSTGGMAKSGVGLSVTGYNAITSGDAAFYTFGLTNEQIDGSASYYYSLQNTNWDDLGAGLYSFTTFNDGVNDIQSYVATSYIVLHHDGSGNWSDPDAKIIADVAAFGFAKDDVSNNRTWTWPKRTGNSLSPSVVSVHPSFAGTLAFDLTNQLADDSAVLTVTSVTVSPSGPTITGPNGTANPSKTSNGKKVLFDIDGGQADATDYTFTCNVTTTDSDDALVVTGLMQSRATT